MISGRKFAALAIPIFSVRSVLFWSVSIFSVRSMLFWSVSSGSCPVASSRCSCVGVWSVVEVVVDLEKRKQPQLWFHELLWINWVRAYVSCLVILVTKNSHMKSPACHTVLRCYLTFGSVPNLHFSRPRISFRKTTLMLIIDPLIGEI